MSTKTNELFEQGTIEILAVKPGFDLTSSNVEDLQVAWTRKTLFFDENVPVYILLHLPSTADSHAAADIASRTSLSLEAFVSDANARSNAPPLARQDSFSSRQHRQDQGQVLYNKAMEAASHTQISPYKDHQVIIWCHATFLPFTPTKTSLPRVSYAVSMTLNEFGPADAGKERDAYLEPDDFVSRDKSYNLLRALENDVFLRHNPPRISASSVSTMSPIADPGLRKAKKSGKRYFPIASAISLQVRSFNFPSSNRILLSADLETTEHVKHVIHIESIELEVKAISSKPIGDIAFPILLKPKDVYTCGFDLDCEASAAEAGSDLSVLIKIHARPMLHEDEALGGPTLQSKWNTALHLPGTAKSINRPASILPPPRVQRSTSNLHLRHSTGPLSPRESPPVNMLAGVTVRITTPPTGVIGQIIHIPLLVSNTSATTKNLNIDVSRRRKELPRLPESAKEVDTTETSSQTILTDEQMAALHQRHTVEPIDFICLTNSIKVGILTPEAQVTVSLQYLALRRGFVALQDLRVVELGSGTFQEIKDLPEIYIR